MGIDELTAGIIVGILFGLPLFASVRWFLIVLLNIIAGVTASVLTTGVEALNSMVCNIISRFDAHPRMVIGLLFGALMIGVITCILRHVQRERDP